MGFVATKIDHDITLIHETGVDPFMRCNIWHIQGNEFDLVVDTGMGLDSLKQYLSQHTDRPLKAILTHCHFDHSGGLHEFSHRLGHPDEADILSNPTNKEVVFDGAWTRIDIVDLNEHPDFSASNYQVSAAPLTHYVDEGDVIDLGQRVLQVLHLPGHSPGSIGLWDRRNDSLFSGDALYDGELLDSLYHSNRNTYLQTLARIESLDIKTFHAGHYDSFGKDRMKVLIDQYRAGENVLADVEDWYRQTRSDNEKSV